MSHEIEQYDTVIFGNNKPAWHGLGTVFPGLFSPLRVFAEGVGHRDIIEVPILLNGLPLEEKKGLIGITASGVQVPLSVVGDNYGVLKSETVFKVLEEVYGGRAVVETAGTLRNGKREWVLVRRDSWDVTSGDKVLCYDLWLNRHDGSGCFELHRTNVRVVCANTWKLAVSGGNRAIGVRHTCNVEQLVRASINALQSIEETEMKQRLAAQKMAKVAMTVTEANRAFETLLGVKTGVEISTRTENQLTELTRLFVAGSGNIGRTRWDGFNAVTEFVDHSRSSRVSEGRNEGEVRFESVLMGSGDALKAKAFDLLAN
jgi:hypothetical protein